MKISDVKFRDNITRLLTSMSAKRACEIGVLRGNGLRLLNSVGMELIVGVDMWQPYGEKNDYDLGQCYKQAHGVKDDLGNVILIQEDSVKAASFFTNGFFDIVYIDASHFYEQVVKDLNAWWPKVRKGGVFAGHDYVDKSRFGDEFGVIQAVDEFAAKHKLNIHVTEDKFRSWLTYRN